MSAPCMPPQVIFPPEEFPCVRISRVFTACNRTIERVGSYVYLVDMPIEMRLSAESLRTVRTLLRSIVVSPVAAVES